MAAPCRAEKGAVRRGGRGEKQPQCLHLNGVWLLLLLLLLLGGALGEGFRGHGEGVGVSAATGTQAGRRLGRSRGS